jgi:hypothetical protein
MMMTMIRCLPVRSNQSSSLETSPLLLAPWFWRWQSRSLAPKKWLKPRQAQKKESIVLPFFVRPFLFV